MCRRVHAPGRNLDDQSGGGAGQGLGVKAERSVTYARGESREAFATASRDVRRYRGDKLIDSAAAMPAFTGEQRSEMTDD